MQESGKSLHPSQGIMTITILEHEPLMFMASDPIFRRVLTNSMVPIKSKKERELDPGQFSSLINVPMIRYETSFEKLLSGKDTIDKELKTLLQDALFLAIEFDARLLFKLSNRDWTDVYSWFFPTKELHEPRANAVDNIYRIAHGLRRQNESGYMVHDLQNDIFVILNCIHLTQDECDQLRTEPFNRIIASTNRTHKYHTLEERDEIMDKLYRWHIRNVVSHCSRWHDQFIRFDRTFN